MCVVFWDGWLRWKCHSGECDLLCPWEDNGENGVKCATDEGKNNDEERWYIRWKEGHVHGGVLAAEMVESI